MTGAMDRFVPVVADRDATEDIDNDSDETEQCREDGEPEYRCTKFDSEGSDVGSVAKDAAIEKENRQFRGPDGELVVDLCPPEPLRDVRVVFRLP